LEQQHYYFTGFFFEQQQQYYHFIGFLNNNNKITILSVFLEQQHYNFIVFLEQHITILSCIGTTTLPFYRFFLEQQQQYYHFIGFLNNNNNNITILSGFFVISYSTNAMCPDLITRLISSCSADDIKSFFFCFPCLVCSNEER